VAHASCAFGSGRAQPTYVVHRRLCRQAALALGIDDAGNPDLNLATGQMRQAVGGRRIVARILLATPTTESCAPPDSLAAALCQLEALNGAIAAGVSPGRLRDRLSGLVAKSSSFATASGQQTGRLRRKSLNGARSAVNRTPHLQLRA
jgi:hypothetical protein